MIALSVELPQTGPKSPHTFSADALMVIRCSSVKMERRYFVTKTK
mgnify:CR=1 FL=1